MGLADWAFISFVHLLSLRPNGTRKLISHIGRERHWRLEPRNGHHPIRQASPVDVELLQDGLASAMARNRSNS